MNVLIASDSYKGSFTSLEVGKLIETGIKKVYPGMNARVVSVADGGEGTVKSVVSAVGGEYVTIKVTGPMEHVADNKVDCTYGILNNNIAVIEMAESSGLNLVPDGMKNPLKTTTYGLGELIKDAVKRGCSKIFIGIGGSATNDLGIGMAKLLAILLLIWMEMMLTVQVVTLVKSHQY
jgi:glycerate 2-kinase